MKIQMKGLMLAAGLVFAGASVAGEPSAEIGEKIYKRGAPGGMGCGGCHEAGSNPRLPEVAKTKTKEEITQVLINGRNGMPKVMDSIMGVGAVKEAGLTQDQAVESLLLFLKK